MKKALKIILISILVLLLVVIGGGYLYLKTSFPKVSAAPDIKVEITPERIERGKYLANHVALCMDCHSERDWHKFSGPPIAGTEGIGGEIFDQNFGFPGAYYARNITPAGLGNWTDGEILRAMTAGVNKDGEPLFPVMPYMSFRNIPREDLFSIIAYLRTLDPIEKELPESKSDFPMNLIINMIPNDPDLVGPVSKDDKLAWGKVLSSACYDCHTPMKKGRPIKELAFSGGYEFKLWTGGVVTSPNLTMDGATGLGKWTEEQFIQRFKQYADSSYLAQEIKENEFNTVMPWIMFSGMTEHDLSSLYTYLKSLDPIENSVIRFVPDQEKK